MSFLKKSLLMASGLLSLALIIWEFFGNYRLCDLVAKDGHLGNCPFILSSAETFLLPFVSLFLFSLVTYFMREEVFRTWAWFALPWTALSMVLIYLTPEYSGGGGFGPQIVLGKGDTALAMMALFVVISIIVIVSARIVSARKARA